jgi:hypothetical protein
MANILTAAAKGAQDRIADSMKEAKNRVIDQMDPSKAIYNLGLGVGPLIKQTVAEYNKQQQKKSETPEDKKTRKDISDIKNMTTGSQKNLGNVAAQLSSMNNILSDIRKINIAQLDMIRSESRKGSASYSVKAAVEPGSTQRDVKKADSGILDSLGDLISGNLGNIAKVGAGLAIGGIVWNNREQIKKFLDEFLQGAGLPKTEVLADQVKDKLIDMTKEVGTIVGNAVIEGVKASVIGIPDYISQAVKEAVGLGRDERGNALPQSSSKLGGLAGGAAGFLAARKLGVGFVGSAIAGAGGALFGSENPEGTLGTLGAAAAGYGLWKGGRAAAAARAEQTAAAQATQAAAGSRTPVMPWQVATPGAPTSNMKMSPGGIILPETSGARSAATQKSIADAASKNITAMDKAQVATKEALSSIGKFGREAGSIVGKYGRAMGGLGTILALPDIYDDIKDGDYAAAGVRFATLVGTLGLGALAPVSAGASLAGSVALSVGGNYAANALKKNKPTPQTRISSTTPEYDVMGNVTGGTTSSQSNATPENAISTTAEGMSKRNPTEGDLSFVPKDVLADKPFMDEVQRVADKYKIKTSDLLAVIKAESNFNPSAKNPRGTATGLIQFIESTAKSLGTSTAQLATMSRAQQMKYVDEYFAQVGLPTGANAGQIYAAIFKPAALKNKEFVFHKAGTQEYQANKELDKEGKGYISLADLENRMAAVQGSKPVSGTIGGEQFSNQVLAESKYRQMGFDDAKIQSITENQKAIREMTDMANIIPIMLGTQSPPPMPSAQTSNDRPAPKGAVNSPEKEELKSYLRKPTAFG